MRRPPRQHMAAIIGIVAIAALIGATLGARGIAAQEATPGATAEAAVAPVPAGAAPADIATPSETDQASETPPAPDDENGDPDPGAEAPAPSEAPMPSLAPSPAAGASAGSEREQPAPSPSPIASQAAAGVAATTPAAGSCQAGETGETALPDVQVSGTGFGAPVFDGTSYIPVTTTIAVTLTRPARGACLAPHWRIAITATAMQSAAAGATPAGDITYHDSSELTAPGLVSAGLAPGTSLTTAQTIVTGTNLALAENQPSVTFTTTLTWSPPANAIAGQYTTGSRSKASPGRTPDSLPGWGEHGRPSATREIRVPCGEERRERSERRQRGRTRRRLGSGSHRMGAVPGATPAGDMWPIAVDPKQEESSP